MVTLDTQSLISAGKLSADARDLAFTSPGAEGPLARQIESGLNTRATVVWLSVPEIPPGPSSLAMYYGNADAVAGTRSPFVDGVITNPSFETFGGWTLDANVGNTILAQADPGWSTDGSGSLFMDEEVNGERPTTLYTTLMQNMTFPEGVEYVIRFDLDVLAASNGAAYDSADFFVDLARGSTTSGSSERRRTSPVFTSRTRRSRSGPAPSRSRSASRSPPGTITATPRATSTTCASANTSHPSRWRRSAQKPRACDRAWLAPVSCYFASRMEKA